jgi:hypothetical protein
VEDAELEARFAGVEERVRRLEDQVAIHRLINSWGPAVDTGQAGPPRPSSRRTPCSSPTCRT